MHSRSYKKNNEHTAKLAMVMILCWSLKIQVSGDCLKMEFREIIINVLFQFIYPLRLARVMLWRVNKSREQIAKQIWVRI